MNKLTTLIALSLLAANAVRAAEPAAHAAATPSPAPAQGNAAKPQQAAKPAAPVATDANAIELDTTQITGNRELPRVLYVVPWKRADLGELSGKPAKSLLDEVLAPVDRDVFQRQNRYHDALQPDAAAAPKAPVAPPAN